jgi:hypothetical protein
METIQAMRRQEDDYSITAYDSKMSETDIDIRSKMIDWCCRVVTYCNLEIEIVAIAMNYTDRMCVYQSHILYNNPFQYQLVAMTSLYIAAKIHAPEALDPKLVSNLSRGTYSAQEIEEQERIILKTLAWKVNPPTAHSMLRQFIELVSITLSIEEQQASIKIALQQIDTYTWTQNCSTAIPISIVAYCAFMNALGYLSLFTLTDKQAAFGVGYNLAQLINIDLISDEIILSKTQRLLEGSSEQSQASCEQIAVLHENKKRIRLCTETVTKNVSSQLRRHSPVYIMER